MDESNITKDDHFRMYITDRLRTGTLHNVMGGYLEPTSIGWQALNYRLKPLGIEHADQADALAEIDYYQRNKF